MTSREISAIVRRMALKHGIKFVVVDYLQKVKADIKHEKRTYEVADISGKLRAVTVETNVSMVTLAQLNRDNQKDKGRAPRLSDFGDSGQIERDADTAILIHRDGPESFLIVAKQRDGETGIVPVHFDGPHCRFENAASNPEPKSNCADRD
jgi:replicative DNA helicase